MHLMLIGDEIMGRRSLLSTVTLDESISASLPILFTDFNRSAFRVEKGKRLDMAVC